MSNQYTNDNATPGTAYIPGEFYDATRGITLPQFTSDQDISKSIPAEDGFIRNPGAKHHAVLVANLSGKDLCVVLDRAKPINHTVPMYRENEREVNGFYLPNGESSHFNIPPFCYHVTVTQFVESENGGRKILTREGFPLMSIQDQVITYVNGEAQGIVKSIESTAHINHYAILNNFTSYRLTVTITKSTTAYGQSPEEVAASKVSRLPDRGGDPVETNAICAGGSWHFKAPPRLYTCRALQPNSISTGTDRIMGQGNDRVPGMDDYVELSAVNCMGGQVVVFLADVSRNGQILGKTYNAGEIKLVKSTIVQTEQDHNA